MPATASFLAVRCVLWQTIHRTAKVSEEVNRKCPSRKTPVQLLTPTLTQLSTTTHSATDGRTDGRTDDSMKYDANSRSYCEQYNRLKMMMLFY